jgi:hypothetical protein
MPPPALRLAYRLLEPALAARRRPVCTENFVWVGTHKRIRRLSAEENMSTVGIISVDATAEIPAKATKPTPSIYRTTLYFPRRAGGRAHLARGSSIDRRRSATAVAQF